jgi:hypothetical protein
MTQKTEKKFAVGLGGRSGSSSFISFPTFISGEKIAVGARHDVPLLTGNITPLDFHKRILARNLGDFPNRPELYSCQFLRSNEVLNEGRL